MVIKVYISGISGNKEVKKRQQRVLLILDSKSVKYEVIDIAEPGAEELKDFMQNKSTASGGTISDPNPRHPLPPQIFNDDEYCGDYDMFDMANEIDEMEKFLKVEPNSLGEQTATAEVQLKNGDISIDEKIDKLVGSGTGEEESKENEVPNDQEAKEDKDSEDKKEESVETEASPEKETEEETAQEEPAENTETVEKDTEDSTQKEGSVEKEEPTKETGDDVDENEEEDDKEDEKEASPEKSDE
ncbi:unnamed protein product [Diabrotica balteata]|uniref:SH3 domain-binding glutamic acid-rich protein homolog n=1 Tax=Diabrotica balteata TaxID=107213 RepID=A0A9N9XDF0_DIABA|nr:unnamed protein product [Diabrotica balteata]